MKAIIKGRKYDTTTAKEVGWDNNGRGGPSSKYCRSVGLNEWSGDEKITPLTTEEAKKWAESHLRPDEYDKIFGEVEE